jgi:hypothetical protein
MSVPVIAISAFPSFLECEKSSENIFDVYMEKPFLRSDVLIRKNKFIRPVIPDHNNVFNI